MSGTKRPLPWTVTEDQPLMLTVCPSDTETYLFDYVSFWAKRKGDDVELLFGVATVEIHFIDDDLIVTDLLDSLAAKKVVRITEDKDRLRIVVVEAEDKPMEDNDGLIPE